MLCRDVASGSDRHLDITFRLQVLKAHPSEHFCLCHTITLLHTRLLILKNIHVDLCLISLIQWTHNRGPARTSVNWGVHGNTSCPPSWRAMNQLIYQSPTQIALLHASAVERELWKLNAHFV